MNGFEVILPFLKPIENLIRRGPLPRLKREAARIRVGGLCTQRRMRQEAECPKPVIYRNYNYTTMKHELRRNVVVAFPNR